MSKICVIGLGYIGLPTACLLAKNGHEVFGVDVDERKVELINRGEAPFSEDGMEDLLKSVAGKNLKAFTKPRHAEIFIIAVPTPFHENKKADLRFVESATNSILSVLDNGNLVILESTVSPHTTEDIVGGILKSSGKSFDLVYCPERAIPGSTLHEMVNNDRIIGGINEKSTYRAKEIYSTFVNGNIYTTNLLTAECCKLAENSFRDVNIAYANELSMLSDELDIDVNELISLANKHPRVNILDPSVGVGGHCIPIDPWFLVENTSRYTIIHKAREINDNMPKITVDRLLKKSDSYNISRKDLKIGILGVAYKPNVDDARESPAEKICDILTSKNIEFKVTDPYVKNFKYKVEFLDSVLEWANIIIIVTNHDVYNRVKLSHNIQNKIIML